jgi:DNA-binding transcriptional LysR family regulator
VRVLWVVHQLHVFVAVAEYGAISEAARGLHLSPSAVSATLTDLEAAFGVQLGVRRRAHGVALTRSGTALLERARELLRHAAELEAEAVGTGRSSPDRWPSAATPRLGPRC